MYTVLILINLSDINTKIKYYIKMYTVLIILILWLK